MVSQLLVSNKICPVDLYCEQLSDASAILAKSTIMETLLSFLKIVVTIAIGYLVFQWIFITHNSIQYIARQEPVVERHTVEICDGKLEREIIDTRTIINAPNHI